MAINSVKLTLNGQDYLLTYDSVSGKYKATVTAPAVSSWMVVPAAANLSSHPCAG